MRIGGEMWVFLGGDGQAFGLWRGLVKCSYQFLGRFLLYPPYAMAIEVRDFH